MAYTDIDKPEDYFNTKLWTGTGASNSITGVGFQPDLAWIKRRNTAGGNMFTDIVRGVTKTIISNETSAEQTFAQGLTSFDSDGFTVGSEAGFNNSGDTFVGWSWLAGGTSSSNTDGSITSNVSANTTSGFSIVKYTGTGSPLTCGHGLGVVPKVIITKGLDVTNNWLVYTEMTGNDRYLKLQGTDAQSGSSIDYWNNTSPTSSVFSIGTTDANNNNGGENIAYCFAEKKGFSKFGSYTGNGSTDGTFVYTGFKPAFIIQKNTSVSQGWQLQDNKRLGYNPDNYLLQPHTSQSESALQRVDLLSNGFKVRTTDAGQNASGNNYIYMCFAENPFVTSAGIPTTAR